MIRAEIDMESWPIGVTVYCEMSRGARKEGKVREQSRPCATTFDTFNVLGKDFDSSLVTFGDCR